MASITIKNIPDDLYERLKRTAELHHRSLNGELIHCLEITLKPQTVAVRERLDRIRRLRPDADSSAITPEEITDAIDQGRP